MQNGDTAIHLAIERDHVETVAFLHQLAKTHDFNENVESKVRLYYISTHICMGTE